MEDRRTARGTANYPRRHKLTIWREQDGRCHWCGVALVPVSVLRGRVEERVSCCCKTCARARGFGYSTGRVANWDCLRAQLDHVVPFLLGGACERSNLVYACTRCNQRRGGRITEATLLARRPLRKQKRTLENPRVFGLTL